MTDSKFVLSKNSWHVKLMKFIWNLDHKAFSYMCPYFWLSVFNVLIIVPFLPIKGIKVLFKKVDAYLTARGDRRDKEKRGAIKAYIQKLKDDDKEVERVIALPQKKFDKLIKELYWEGEGQLAHVLITLRDSKYGLALKSDPISDKQRAAKIFAIIKPIMEVFLFILGLMAIFAVACGLYMLVMFFINNPATFNRLLEALGLLVAVVVMLAIVFWLSLSAVNKVSRRGTIGEYEVTKFDRVSDIIASPLVWIYDGMALLGRVIRDLYNKSCPPIDWE